MNSHPQFKDVKQFLGQDDMLTGIIVNWSRITSFNQI